MTWSWAAVLPWERGGQWVFLGGGPAVVLALSLVAVFVLILGFHSSRGLPPARRAVLLGVRLAALLAAAAAILRPARETEIVRPRKQPLAFVVDASRSMRLGAEPAGPALVRWLEQTRRDREGLGEFFRAEFLGLGDPAPGVDPAVLSASGAFNGPSTPLSRTLESLERSRPDLSGIVLLSDGRDTERLGDAPPSLSIPVYPVIAGSGEVRDLRIDALDAPPIAFIRTPVEVQVRLALSGLPPGKAVVTLLDGEHPLRSETVAVGKEGAVATMVFTPTRTGRKAYRVEVTPWPGDAVRENNRAQFEMNVIRDKTRVLLVAGTPTWDVKFLRRWLTRDPGVDLITFLILRTPEDVSLVPQEELSLIPFPTEELFNQELPSFDAVIFANFDHGPYVPRQYLANLVRFVRESGGGFAMMGGDRSLALGGYVGSPLEEILPAEISGASPGQEYLARRFRPRLTNVGLTHPLFQWRPSSQENRLLWNGLPDLEGMNWVLRPKANAVVLAENPEARNEFGPMPLIVLGEYGSGRTMLVATDSLWRWAASGQGQTADDSPYRAYWTRALRWLSHDPEMELVRLAPPAGPLRAGDPVRFRARVFDRSYNPASGAQLKGALTGPSGGETPLRWREVAPGEYAAEPVTPERDGVWRVEVEARRAADLLGRDAAELAVEPESPEALRVGVDEAFLESLARASGGRTFRAGDRGLFRFLADKGRSALEVVGRRVEEVWATGPALLAAILLFGADWGLRRFWE